MIKNKRHLNTKSNLIKKKLKKVMKLHLLKKYKLKKRN